MIQNWYSFKIMSGNGGKNYIPVDCGAHTDWPADKQWEHDLYGYSNGMRMWAFSLKFEEKCVVGRCCVSLSWCVTSGCGYFIYTIVTDWHTYLSSCSEIYANHKTEPFSFWGSSNNIAQIVRDQNWNKSNMCCSKHAQFTQPMDREILVAADGRDE